MVHYRAFSTIVLLATSGLTLAFAQGRPRGPASLEQRADSLEALDPAVELRAAITAGDLRLIGVCGYACLPPGVDVTDSVVIRAFRASGLHNIKGTSDGVSSDAVARLNQVAADYGARYNRLLISYLRNREARAAKP